MSAMWRRAGMPVRLLLAALLWLALGAAAVQAAERVQVHATAEQGFGRIVLQFTDRMDLPKYKISFDNGVLAVTFADPVSMTLPDLLATAPAYLTIGRVDPDGKGVRFGLRTAFNIHSMEAGEKLFIDMMPEGWQGLPPSLPPAIVAQLTERAKNAAVEAEQRRKAEEAKALNPQVALRAGRNPTFMRVEFDWSVDTKAEFVQNGTTATLTFDWPVEIDLYALKSQLPSEITGISSEVSTAGSKIVLALADGVTPRFYGTDARQFILDVDLTNGEIAANRTTAEAAAKAAEATALAARVADAMASSETSELAANAAGTQVAASDQVPGAAITPRIEEISGTVRVSFPFDRDTASAVFRRGDTLWMLFDTPTSINQPEQSDALSSIATGFTVVPAGETQIVRVDLSTEKLATLASEGRSWVLSIGDVLLNATEPLTLKRNRDPDGHFEMTAALGKPYQVHSFRDPVVGDFLDVVTAFPPARGSARDLSYVDFDALRSVHGLVVRPDNADLDVSVVDDHALIKVPDGLMLSDQDAPRALDSGSAAEFRDSFVDFAALKEDNPAAFEKKGEELSEDAAVKEGQSREVARLALAQYYVGNQYAEEAIGVLKVLDSDLKSDDLRKKVKLTSAIANVLAARSGEALDILNSTSFSDEVDAVMWRTIARADVHDFAGARSDALAAESVVQVYPVWVRQKFLFAGIRAALETSDVPLAQRYLGLIVFAQLSPEDVTLYQLFQGRVAEAQGQVAAALDTYGQVIAADVRPTRAEAVYRTLLLLRSTGKIDLAKATATLSAEAMLWRGNPLEADMEKLLAELYFEHKDYRFGFETVKDAAAHNPDSKPIGALIEEAGIQFGNLFLNGAADQLGDLDALSLYYDFRQLTPPGARGDEMIRNLARRLVKVDLLGQAAELLEYQIDSRLKGVAQAQVAADLALIRIADRNPEAALRVLNRTRVADLSPTLERQRRVLEARALIDADRADLALDLLTRVSGRDADLLRVDGYWKAKNYTAASDLIETVYSADDTATLSQPARMNILKAAVGLVLAGDELGLNRLRSKFSDRMAQAQEWPMFDYITSPNVSMTGMQFKAAAKAVSGLDSITAFLNAYRQLYAVDPALTPVAASARSSV
ncbi:MAG: hypothetical protein HY834_02745 [Devosia nanyangense]|uniref:Tetratricopeptide repeat protein n=1 Tax=Devosia nanyangense TaxID=1228055 RepID=A0A933KZD6_9HYPH|nr:hypothetical protein [Devosia nanyangense]